MLPDDNTVPNQIDSSNESTIPMLVDPAGEQTVPVLIDEPTIAVPIEQVSPRLKGKKEKAKKAGPQRALWILLGLFILLGLGAGGMYMGYEKGIQERLAKQNENMAVELVTQFELGIKDMEAGRLEVARQRFETVIQYNPNYPGAMERLTQVMLSIAKTTAPTPVPTPTVSPTPDTRGIEEKFNTAYTLVRNQDWEKAIVALEALRKEDKTYHTVEVDGMFYIALRESGVQKIKAGGLEQGMYDLSLASRFAPLDKDAEGFRTWARLYVIGVSFWELDWAQVVDYFRQVYSALPYLSDGSGWTAGERYRIALWRYGDQYVNNSDYCTAREQYRISLSIVPDPKLAPTATEASYICEPPTEVPTAGPPKPKKTTATPAVTPTP